MKVSIAIPMAVLELHCTRKNVWQMWRSAVMSASMRIQGPAGVKVLELRSEKGLSRSLTALQGG